MPSSKWFLSYGNYIAGTHTHTHCSTELFATPSPNKSPFFVDNEAIAPQQFIFDGGRLGVDFRAANLQLITSGP